MVSNFTGGDFLNSRPLPWVILSDERKRWVLLAQCFLRQKSGFHTGGGLDSIPVAFIVVVSQAIGIALLIRKQECYKSVSR